MFIIRNISASVVSLGDLGLELQPSEEYNFSENESPNDVQNSTDLRDRITAADIAVLDPLDNVTALNTIRSLEVVDLSNSPNYRIFGGDLNQLEDVTVTSPVNGELLVYDGSQWINQLLGQVGDLPALQLERTASFTIPATWGTISFPNVLIENQPTILQRDPVDDTTIVINESGLYYFIFTADVVGGDQETRALANGTTVIPASNRQDANPMVTPFICDCAAGDTIQFQAQITSGSPSYPQGVYVSVYKLQGIRGDQGPPGSGSSINVEDEGSIVPGGPHDTLNFVGPGVVVTDAGSGEATVTITGTPQSHLLRTNGTTVQTFNTTPVTLLVGTNVRSDTEFSYSAGVVTVNTAGWYDIVYDVTTEHTSGTGFFSTDQATAQGSIYINGVEDIDTRAYGWHHGDSGARITFTGRAKVQLAANDDIEVRIVRSGGDNLGLQTVAQGCRLAIQSIDAP